MLFVVGSAIPYLTLSKWSKFLLSHLVLAHRLVGFLPVSDSLALHFLKKQVQVRLALVVVDLLSNAVLTPDENEIWPNILIGQ